jgi:hypothetical protein
MKNIQRRIWVFLGLVGQFLIDIVRHQSSRPTLILTPPSSTFLALAIQNELAKRNITTIVRHRTFLVLFTKMCLVIAPQAFRKLPRHFIAFQVEQLASTRGLESRLETTLASSELILEYSPANLEILRDRFGSRRIEVYPPPLMNLIDPMFSNFQARDIQVLFYGWNGSERRSAAIERLSESFSVEIVEGVYGDALYKLISRSLCVVNIHFYQGAILESIRLSESLSLGTPVVSEDAIDRCTYPYKNLVDFAPTGNWDELINSVHSVVTNSEDWTIRHKNITKAVQQANRETGVMDRLARTLDSGCSSETN